MHCLSHNNNKIIDLQNAHNKKATVENGTALIESIHEKTTSGD
jgi:hypothetical protein